MEWCDCIIIVILSKDFSRFSRDYVEIGECFEYLFPYLGVRYISINDGYDSNDYKGTTGTIDVVMRAIMYDAYSKDLSLKSKTGRIQSWKKGRRSCGHPDYGYVIDPNRRAMDIIDPEAAAVVRRIFDSAIAGMPTGDIATMLNKENITTPSMYFRQKNQNSKKYGTVSKKQHWTCNSVYVILTRYTYTGAVVGGRRERIAPCQPSMVTKKREDWIIIPNIKMTGIMFMCFGTFARAVCSKLGRGIYSIRNTLKKSRCVSSVLAIASALPRKI